MNPNDQQSNYRPQPAAAPPDGVSQYPTERYAPTEAPASVPPQPAPQTSPAPQAAPDVQTPEVQPQPTQPLQTSPVIAPVQPEATQLAPADAPAEASQPQTPPIPDTPVQWNAQEYVHLDKGTWWYVIFAAVAIGFIALDFFLLRSWTFTLLVVVMAVALIVYVRRPPRTLQYAISPREGLYVGEKLYQFEDFKSFGVIEDDGHQSIMLIPVKRFSPGVSVYFPADAGEEIVDMLAAHLPMQELHLDPIDLLVRKLRL